MILAASSHLSGTWGHVGTKPALIPVGAAAGIAGAKNREAGVHCRGSRGTGGKPGPLAAATGKSLPPESATNASSVPRRLMSIIASLRSAPPAFSALNLHPHGHKKGPHLQSIGDSDSGNSAPVPTRLRQTLFGTLLNSLEQAIGVQTASAAAAATGSPAPAGTRGRRRGCRCPGRLGWYLGAGLDGRDGGRRAGFECHGPILHHHAAKLPEQSGAPRPHRRPLRRERLGPPTGY